MKLFVRGLLAGAGLLAGVILTGCGSPVQGPIFLDNPQPRNLGGVSAAGGQSTESPSAATVAHFRVGDDVTVSFSGIPIEIPAHEEAIKEDGTITLPYIGAIYALGKTAGQLQTEIHDDYVPKYYVRLTVTVGSGERIYYIGGEVKSPGRESYVDGITVTKAIQSASGLTDFANHGKIWLLRASTGQRIRVDYDKAIQNPAKDPQVYPNDQINVEKRIF